MLFFFPLFLSVFATASSIETIEHFSISQRNCYDGIPVDFPLLEFDLSKTDKRVFDATNILSDDYLTLLKGALEDGVDFNVPCLYDQFPIHFAINTGRREMFDLLLKNVNLNQRCTLGLTPLHHALLEENLYFIKELLRNGANPHERALLEWEDEKRKRHSIMGRLGLGLGL